MHAIRTTLEFDIKTFNPERPKALVISHERSGTHFLMNSLAANFDYISNPFMNIDSGLGVNYHSPVAFQELLNNFRYHSVANVFKSHHTLDFYRNVLPASSLRFKIIYIYRDVYEVQASYHQLLLAIPWNEGPRPESLSEFLRRVPEGAMTRYQYRHVHSMVDRWVQHVESALEGRSFFDPADFLMVSYRELNQNFDATLDRIAVHLGVPKSTTNYTRPPRDLNVVPPILQLSDKDIMSYYTSEDIDFVEQVAGPTRDKLASL